MEKLSEERIAELREELNKLDPRYWKRKDLLALLEEVNEARCELAAFRIIESQPESRSELRSQLSDAMFGQRIRQEQFENMANMADEAIEQRDLALKELATASRVSAPSACTHEEMWFSRAIEEDGRMHYFCEKCGMRDDRIAESAPSTVKHCLHCGDVGTFVAWSGTSGYHTEICDCPIGKKLRAEAAPSPAKEGKDE